LAIINSCENNNSTYSASDFNLNMEQELSTVLFICGLDGSALETYEIDEIVDAIRNLFYSSTDTAADMILDKWSRQLLLVARRNSRRHKIAVHSRDYVN
jgi:hypothetical protein